MSGQIKAFPSDVLIEDVLCECKVRSSLLDAKEQRYIRLDMDWLRGVEENAERMGYRAGVLVVNAKGSQTPHVLLPLDLTLELMRYRKEKLDG